MKSNVFFYNIRLFTFPRGFVFAPVSSLNYCATLLCDFLFTDILQDAYFDVTHSASRVSSS